MMLDREMEDERDEDPGVELSTDEYDGGEELAAEQVDKGIAVCLTAKSMDLDKGKVF